MLKNSYITIQSWMITELNLSGNDLLVYAILFGFSQDKESCFEGNLQYLADWCNCTKRGIYKNIDNLINLNLIEKTDDGKYRTKFTNCEQSSPESVNKVHSDNIYNNISTKVDINKNNTNVLLFTQKPKRMNLFDKCYLEITTRYTDEKLKDILVDYLKMSLERKDEKRLKSHAQWKGLLNKLDNMTGDKIAIVNQSIKKYWATFVEVKQYKYNNTFGEQNVQSIVASQDERKEIERWQTENGIESF